MCLGPRHNGFSEPLTPGHDRCKANGLLKPLASRSWLARELLQQTTTAQTHVGEVYTQRNHWTAKTGNKQVLSLQGGILVDQQVGSSTDRQVNFYADNKPQTCTPSRAFGVIDPLQLRAEILPCLRSSVSNLHWCRSVDLQISSTSTFAISLKPGSSLVPSLYLILLSTSVCTLFLSYSIVRRQLVSRDVSRDHRRGVPSAPLHTCS